MGCKSVFNKESLSLKPRPRLQGEFPDAGSAYAQIVTSFLMHCYCRRLIFTRLLIPATRSQQVAGFGSLLVQFLGWLAAAGLLVLCSFPVRVIEQAFVREIYNSTPHYVGAVLFFSCGILQQCIFAAIEWYHIHANLRTGIHPQLGRWLPILRGLLSLSAISTFGVMIGFMITDFVMTPNWWSPASQSPWANLVAIFEFITIGLLVLLQSLVTFEFWGIGFKTSIKPPRLKNIRFRRAYQREHNWRKSLRVRHESRESEAAAQPSI
ncbi:hypothetical protein PAPYR_7801 [Paratrimastix pyriformis]|uniref:Uncharacterized protein n=1 Tax=Paratrimastix pyriformis TaxID=342808 RepID=A0ABQ8UHH2_9EUKA|nr:hypothetical protein PAPYR_7801 [Paratrimastix pyriformis]